MSGLWPTERILRPSDTLAGVTTKMDYYVMQRALIQQGREKLPRLNWLDPWEVIEAVQPYVNWGRWMVKCACGNCPLFSPEWMCALCFECGAKYHLFDLPEAQTLIEVERVLLLRPQLSTRNWRVPGQRPESVEDLVIENVEHGDPVPEDYAALERTVREAAQTRREHMAGKIEEAMIHGAADVV